MAHTCPCGRGLHFSNDHTRQLVMKVIEENGELQPVQTPDGTWLVPRLWIALHGLVALELPSLAIVYGWEKVSNAATPPNNPQG